MRQPSATRTQGPLRRSETLFMVLHCGVLCCVEGEGNAEREGEKC
jgi:hypothetical protein